MYALVQGGEVVRVGLPKSGCLSNGCTVTNYHNQPESVLLAEGWLPYTENIPEYNPETQAVEIDYYEILANEVIGHYTAIARTPSLEARLEATENALTDILSLLLFL